MLRAIFVTMAIVVVQAGPYAQGRGRGGSSPTAAPRQTTVRVLVHGTDGASIDGARVSLSGDASAEFTTRRRRSGDHAQSGRRHLPGPLRKGRVRDA